MAAWWWSWLLTAVGVTGLYLAGRKSRWGWAVGLGAQVLWITYALVTSQYGFLASSLAYGAVYGRNLYRWTRERQQDAARAAIVRQMDTGITRLVGGWACGHCAHSGRDHYLTQPGPEPRFACQECGCTHGVDQTYEQVKEGAP